MLPPIEWSIYRARLRDEMAAGWIPAKQYLALVALADLVAAGDDSPTVAKIAVWSGVNPRTVRRARATAEERGLLGVQPQFEPAPEGSGRRRWQTANRYSLTAPDEPVRAKLRKSRGGQRVRPSRGRKEERRLPRVDLEAVACFMNERLALRWAARRSEPTGRG